jgi:SAM-dependent methyltransferase
MLISECAAPNLERVELYACPISRRPLIRRAENLVDVEGQSKYLIENGIPIFLKHPPIESAEDMAKLKRLNSIARERGWESALAEVHGRDSRLFQYVTSAERAAFLDFLPINATSQVLDIGAGLGQFTTMLAARSGFVHALEVVPGQAAFTAERCRQTGASNVSVACGGDDCTLPYVDESFDVVICNLVLEWCASRESGGPREAQRHLLAEICRVLKRGGVVYLATKNRFALKYVLGGWDEHAWDMRFGSALPEWLLRFALKLKGKPAPRGYLYSYRGLKRLLASERLEMVDSYWAVPEYRHPRRFIRLDRNSIKAARQAGPFEQGNSRLSRVMMPWLPAALVKYFAPGLVMVARKVLSSEGNDQMAGLEQVTAKELQ